MSRSRRLTAGLALALIAAGALVAPPSAAPAADGSLLYLVEFAATEAGAPTTRDQAIELLGGLIVPSLESLAADPKVMAGGLRTGARSGAFIVAARSHDEVTEMVRALPAWGVWGWTVTPLESFAHRAGLERAVVERLRAQ